MKEAFGSQRERVRERWSSSSFSSFLNLERERVARSVFFGETGSGVDFRYSTDDNRHYAAELNSVAADLRRCPNSVVNETAYLVSKLKSIIEIYTHVIPAAAAIFNGGNAKTLTEDFRSRAPSPSR